MMRQDPADTSAVDIFVKVLGTSSRAPLPLTAAAHQMLLGSSAMGHGRDDDSLVIRANEALTGSPVHKS